MLVNEWHGDFEVAGVNTAERIPEKPTDYESTATGLERDAFDILEKLTRGIDLIPEYAAEGQRLLVKAREDIEEETNEFLRQLREALDIPQPNHRPNKNALPIELKLEEVVKPRAGDRIRHLLDHNIGSNFVDAWQGYMFDDIKEKYMEAQVAYRSGDKAGGDMLMKNAEGMAAIVALTLSTYYKESVEMEFSKTSWKDILEVVEAEIEQDKERELDSGSRIKACPRPDRGSGMT